MICLIETVIWEVAHPYYLSQIVYTEKTTNILQVAVNLGLMI